ncbi:MAG: hypothetical protein F6K19_01565 [Cyanothece sp. SIO1E1]|nr:hypothetical protein [Cyanothece sp. SIO1E1]
MQHISNKSREKLYEVVGEEVFKTRIKIAKLTAHDEFIAEKIDQLMFNLYVSAPQKAIDCFVYNKER